jgi:hypothetical protein
MLDLSCVVEVHLVACGLMRVRNGSARQSWMEDNWRLRSRQTRSMASLAPRSLSLSLSSRCIASVYRRHQDPPKALMNVCLCG